MYIFVIISMCSSFLGAWLMSRYAYRLGLIDIPNNRSSHNLPTPRGGGIGILAAFVVSSLMMVLPLFFWLPASLLALISFLDDKLGLTPKVRLLFQFTAAMVVSIYAVKGGSWYSGITIDQSQISNIFILIAISLCFSVYIAGTANFYNFMDGINGIAGISGVVGFALLGIFAHFYTSAPVMSLSSLCMSAACIGFLPLNVPRARVFMGDVGSILLGFVFASYVVILAQTIADFFLLAGFLSTFYADTLTTLYIRKKNGERLSQAHRRHLYQLFANQGKVDHWKISVSYGLIQCVVGVALLLLRPYGWQVVTCFEVAMVVGWWQIMVRIRQKFERVTE